MMLFRLMTRAAERLERDVAETEARADAGEDFRRDLPRLGRRLRRMERLLDLLTRGFD